MNVPATRPMALALLLLGAGIPAGLIAPAVGATECPTTDRFGTREDILQSSPLEGHRSATETLHLVAKRTETGGPAAAQANGVDAYVYSLNCRALAQGTTYALYDETPGEEEADYGLAFYDRDFRRTGPPVFHDAEAGNAQLSGTLPAHTAYVVVVLEEGPLVSGVDSEEFPPEPYSARFHLAFNG